MGRQVQLDSRLSAREKAEARKKYEAEQEAEFFERTGIRNEAEDWKLDTMVTKYEYDMALMRRADEKRNQKKARRQQPIDPTTGKPRETSPLDPELPDSSDENDFEALSRENP